MLSKIKNSLNLIGYPIECRVCEGSVTDSRDGIVCQVCWSATNIFSGTEMLCTKCGAFFGPKAAPVEIRCQQCDDHDYDSARAVGIYAAGLAASVIRLKVEPVLPKRIVDLVQEALDRNVSEAVDMIVPVPLSKHRAIERGFNQAEVIARTISKYLKIAVDAHSLVRTKHTKIHRMAMDRRARELTVDKAFAVTRPNLISGKRILLVDDVFTSGSTASGCARALKKAGAESVYVFSLARAVMK